MDGMESGVLTKAEVAGLYRCCTKTVETMWQLGDIPVPLGDRANKKRNKRLWSKAEILADLASKGIAPIEETLSRTDLALHAIASRLIRKGVA